MKKLVILGSCASRDALDYDASGQFELVAYYARSSLASLVSPPFVDEDAVARITSKFQRRMVRKDMAKNLWRELPALDFDLLLLDLIDERFPLLQFPDGARHTLSAEYAAVRDDGQGAVEIGADSAEKQDLWQRGWDALAQILDENGKLDRLVVNKVYWARTDISGSPVGQYADSFIERMNAHLDRMYETIASTQPAIRFIEYAPEILRVDSNHKWGPAPFHYGVEVYKHTIASL